MSQNQDPFFNWQDFYRSFPEAGNGVDHNEAPPTFLPAYPHGFPFPGPTNAAGTGPHSAPPAGVWPPPHPGWGFFYEGGDEEGGQSRSSARRAPFERHGDEHGEGVQTPPSESEAEGQAQPAVDEKEKSPETMRVDDPEEVIPEEEDDQAHGHAQHQDPFAGRHCRGRSGGARGHHFGGRGAWGGGRCGRGRGRGGPNFHHYHYRSPWTYGGPHRGHGAGPHRHRHQSPPPPVDFGAAMRGFMAHPFFQNLRGQAERYFPEAYNAYANAAASSAPQDRGRAEGEDNAGDRDPNTFTPPLDIFATDAAYTLHLALPGAKKEDIGVHWDPDAGELTISGVVHRPGDEAFLAALTATAERRVGLFERKIPLPPSGSSDKSIDVIDGPGISARMQDGILIVVVPKVEREWTQVLKVDVE